MTEVPIAEVLGLPNQEPRKPAAASTAPEKPGDPAEDDTIASICGLRRPAQAEPVTATEAPKPLETSEPLAKILGRDAGLSPPGADTRAGGTTRLHQAEPAAQPQQTVFEVETHPKRGRESSIRDSSRGEAELNASKGYRSERGVLNYVLAFVFFVLFADVVSRLNDNQPSESLPGTDSNSTQPSNTRPSSEPARSKASNSKTWDQLYDETFPNGARPVEPAGTRLFQPFDPVKHRKEWIERAKKGNQFRGDQ